MTTKNKVHLMIESSISTGFYNFIQKEFDKSLHWFYFVNSGNGHGEKSYKGDNILDNTTALKMVYKADQIFVHSLNYKMLLFLMIQPWLLHKVNWIIWGGDLYYFNKPKTTLKTKVFEFVRAFVIKRIGVIISYPTGDYELAKKWYNTRGEFKKCLYYPYFAVEDYLKHIDVSGEEENIIMVGNSADSSNEHLEVFDKISQLEEINNYKIICPLSYAGKQSYIDTVITKGKELFGDRFVPLVDFMNSDEYYKLLSTVKIVIMAHKRQQATGNILSLIKFKKKIYIRNNISTWDFYKENGIKIFDYYNLEDDLFIPMKEEFKEQNRSAIKNNFTYSRVISEWKDIFK